MTALKGAAIDRFLQNPDFTARGILIYGPDAGLVGERAKSLVKAAAGTLDDPFALAKISDADIAANPARLADEVQTISLGGARRVIWVSPADSAFAAAMETCLKLPQSDAVIVAQAGDLRPASKLRKLFEAGRSVVAIPCYADDAGALGRLIDEIVASHNLEITKAARTALIGMLGADRALSRGEVEKLCLYAQGADVIDLGHLDAICGDASAITLDLMIDAAAEGHADMLDQLSSRAANSGISPAQMISQLGRHFSNLHLARAVMRSPSDLDGALGQIRPPVHFKRKPSLKNQLRMWDEKNLREVIRLTGDLERKSRSQGMPPETAIARALLGIATRAARLAAQGR